MKLSRYAVALLAMPFLTGCASTVGSTPGQTSRARVGMAEAIKAEPPGSYYIGRRYYKTDYKFWGFVRSAGQPWSTARLVMMNENQKFAPDRASGKIGADNDYEYKLTGNFSGDTVYEPASNGFYPEFILRGYELRSSTPPPLYKEQGATNPDRRIIATPY